MRCNGASVRPKLLRDFLHARATLVEFDNLIDLGFGEKSLSFPNRPDELAPLVSNRGLQGALARVVDPALPPGDNSLQGRGKVLKVSTQGHQFGKPGRIRGRFVPVGSSAG